MTAPDQHDMCADHRRKDYHLVVCHKVRAFCGSNRLPSQEPACQQVPV
jgi:hypothetical protein